MATANAGRKPRPPSLKLLEGRGPGTDSGGRKVKEGPAFVRLPPEAPDWLPDEARREWERVVSELARLKLAKPVDRAALTAYVLTWNRLVEAQAELSRVGLLHEGRQGLTRHPLVGVVETASKDLRAWCSEFGFTPAAEHKVTPSGGQDGKEDNPFG